MENLAKLNNQIVRAKTLANCLMCQMKAGTWQAKAMTDEEWVMLAQLCLLKSTPSEETKALTLLILEEREQNKPIAKRRK